MREIPEINYRLAEFINNSPTVYNAVENVCTLLEMNGFKNIRETDDWDFNEFASENGTAKVYCVRNGSSVIAAKIPGKNFKGFLITASHGDSPTFRIKENPEVAAEGYIKLNVEKYGGAIFSTWTDRPLSCAGRAVIKSENGEIFTKNVNIDKDFLLIPNVAIHMDRNVNDGKQLNANIDMLPVMCADGGKSFKARAAEELGVPEENILSLEMYLYNRQKCTVWGDGEYFTGPRLDDLACAYGCLEGFLKAENGENATVFCMFDNEEVGSSTKQGADSTFLEDFLLRITESCVTCKIQSEYRRKIAASFMISADNAHAVHPNHPELSDRNNRPYINKGIVIKYNASQKYTTDCVSAAVFAEICKKADVPVQYFTNRADMAGGSTLGNISNAHVSLDTVDIGLPQLAMHSSCETAGTYDVECLEKAVKTFYANVTFRS